LVKGRGNYISIRRLQLATASASELFETDRSRELEALRDWIATTEDGSLSDLAHLPSDDVWDEVRSDPDVCLRTACRHFQDCFYQRSRRRAAAARVLVVNHHLLFTDLAVRRATRNWTQAAVLPPYRHVVLDEAHNVEDAATSHLGVEVSRSGLYRALARLDRKGRGLLASLQKAVGLDIDPARELARDIEERVRPRVDAARARVEAFVDRLEPLVRDGASGESSAVRIRNGRVPGEPDTTGSFDSSVDLGMPLAADPGGPGTVARGGRPDAASERAVIEEPVALPAVHDALRSLLHELQGLERDLSRLGERIDESEELHERVGSRLLDLRSVERRLGAAQVALKLVLEPGEQAERYVRWLEFRGRARRRNLVLAAAPIELGPELRDALWARVDTAVLSSATLTTRQRFDFVRERLGVDADGLADLEDPPTVVERQVASPFDFARQTLLAVPRGLGDASGSGAFQRSTARIVEELAGLTGGGIFVLFTSYRALQAVAADLRSSGVDARWPLFVHGEADRARLLEQFVQHGDAILLGTASFWEGVDVPGRPLRGLVIQKIPFRVPTDPVVAARVEAIERRGGNAFWNYMLPLAALRLKQGFGRLIRSRDDRGAVVLLDDRVLTRRYGSYLVDSLPPAPLQRGDWAELRTRLRDFYLAPGPGAEATFR
jgi:ATP-dependent DNA helicase DinG